MHISNYRHMMTAIKDAIDVLEFKAYRNCYGNDIEHKRVIAYLQNVCAKLKEKEAAERSAAEKPE